MLVACLVDGQPSALPQRGATPAQVDALVRWELAEARALVGAIGGIDRDFAAACAALGADVREVPRLPFAVPNPTANRLQLFAAAREQNRDFPLLLDRDSLVVPTRCRCYAPTSLEPRSRPCDGDHVPALERAFAYCGVPLPEPSYVHRLTGEPTSVERLFVLESGNQGPLFGREQVLAAAVASLFRAAGGRSPAATACSTPAASSAPAPRSTRRHAAARFLSAATPGQAAPGPRTRRAAATKLSRAR